MYTIGKAHQDLITWRMTVVVCAKMRRTRRLFGIIMNTKVSSPDLLEYSRRYGVFLAANGCLTWGLTRLKRPEAMTLR
jgi:hypothetical protein